MKRAFFTLLAASIFFISSSGSENVPVGARSAAMADASVSLQDAWSTHHNQSGLGFIREFSAGIYYGNRFLLKELSVKAATLAFPIKTGTFGLCVTSFGSPLYCENKYSLSFSKPFGDKFSAGLAMTCLATKIAEGYGNKNVFAAELGLLAKPVKGLSLGAHLFNPTHAKLSDYNNERIPTILRLGAAYAFSGKVLLALETEKDIAQKATFKAGIEYNAVNGFYLRAGISGNPVLSTFGLGLHLKNFITDLSFSYHQTLGISPQLSLICTIPKFKKSIVSH